jgi:transcriptional regulator with XRE-family HTH domain
MLNQECLHERLVRMLLPEAVLTGLAKLINCTQDSVEEATVTSTGAAIPSPVGTPASVARQRRAQNPEYLAEQRRIAQFEEIARLVIKHRAALGLSQAELAERLKTSHSVISRIESGQHRTSVQTLQRLAEALGLRFVMGFESGPETNPTRELVTA